VAQEAGQVAGLKSIFRLPYYQVLYLLLWAQEVQVVPRSLPQIVMGMRVYRVVFPGLGNTCMPLLALVEMSALVETSARG
jgi:hypothetical protein